MLERRCLLGGDWRSVVVMAFLGHTFKRLVFWSVTIKHGRNFQLACFGGRLHLSFLEKLAICYLDNPKAIPYQFLLLFLLLPPFLLRKSLFFFIVLLKLVIDRGCSLFEEFFFGFCKAQDLIMLFVDFLLVSLGFHNLSMKIIIWTSLHRINSDRPL